MSLRGIGIIEYRRRRNRKGVRDATADYARVGGAQGESGERGVRWTGGGGGSGEGRRRHRCRGRRASPRSGARVRIIARGIDPGRGRGAWEDGAREVVGEEDDDEEDVVVLWVLRVETDGGGGRGRARRRGLKSFYSVRCARCTEPVFRLGVNNISSIYFLLLLLPCTQFYAERRRLPRRRRGVTTRRRTTPLPPNRSGKSSCERHSARASFVNARNPDSPSRTNARRACAMTTSADAAGGGRVRPGRVSRVVVFPDAIARVRDAATRTVARRRRTPREERSFDRCPSRLANR